MIIYIYIWSLHNFDYMILKLKKNKFFIKMNLIRANSFDRWCGKNFFLLKSCVSKIIKRAFCIRMGKSLQISELLLSKLCIFPCSWGLYSSFNPYALAKGNFKSSFFSNTWIIHIKVGGKRMNLKTIPTKQCFSFIRMIH